MTDSREEHLVELVDDDGRPAGTTTVAAAHERPGRLHRAFSVVLVDPRGRMLLQRRAAVKTRFPLRWANACCGHPAPGEDPAVSANRRLKEELGAAPVALAPAGVYVYYAEDPATGRVEWEYDHVLLGHVSGDEPLLPDPAEVAELTWADPVTLADAIAADPTSYAPWLGGVLARIMDGEGAATHAGRATANGSPSGADATAGRPDATAGRQAAGGAAGARGAGPGAAGDRVGEAASGTGVTGGLPPDGGAGGGRGAGGDAAERSGGR